MVVVVVHTTQHTAGHARRGSDSTGRTQEQPEATEAAGIPRVFETTVHVQAGSGTAVAVITISVRGAPATRF